MDNRTNVFDYIKREETDYKTKSITLGENWMWNMYEHINRSFLLKHSKYTQGTNELGKRPFKNIIRPILNVAYRSEGFDVKNIEPYVNDPENYYKSMVIRKFHPGWALKNKIDTAIDESVESYVDYGLTIAKNVNDVRPEIVPLQRLAFVDQRDVLSGAICERHSYSVDQLQQMKGKWWSEEIDQAIVMARASKPNATGTGEERANSKSIEVYELHGTFPATWMEYKDQNGESTTEDSEEEDTANPDEYFGQLHIVCYYTDEDGDDHGIHLFCGKEKELPYKVLVRDGIFNRACGWGGVEELFEPQTWTNYDIIQVKEMLDVASLMLVQTTDPAFGERNKITDMPKGTILNTDGAIPNSALTQVNLQPINMQQFKNDLVAWEQSARVTGSASDPQLGLDPVSGTPLGTTQIVTDQGQGIHQYRRGKMATFWEEIYRDWSIPFMVAELNKGKVFQEEMSLDELQLVADNIVTDMANDRVKQMVLEGKTPTQADVDTFKEVTKQEFMKGGTTKFFETLKEELKEIPVDVIVNVAGKQSNLAGRADKLSNVLRQIIANPQGFVQAMQIEPVAKTFNQLMEASGLDQINFKASPMQVPPSPVATPAVAPPAMEGAVA